MLCSAGRSAPPMTPAKAILFDFGGTLDADGVPWKDRMRRLCRLEGILDDGAPFDRVFYAADDALVGTIPVSLSLRNTVALLADGVTRGLGVDDPEVAGRLRESFLSEMEEAFARNRPL